MTNCNRECPTAGFLPCSRKDGHLGPCAHYIVGGRDLTKELPPPLIVTLIVWVVLIIFSFMACIGLGYSISMVTQ